VAILSFTASAEEADPGDSITLSWATRGATEIVLYHMMPGGQFGTHWEVEPEGTFLYDIPLEERNRVDFILAATDPAGHLAQQRVSLALRCLDDWFFADAPDICPAGAPLVSPAAEQHFEGGIMLWVEAETRIYVLFDSGSPAWSTFADMWQAGEPESDPELAPPPALYQPVRGFGKVWREEAGVRERLGWALAPETGFTTTVQRTSYSKYNQTYLRALAGGVWKLLAEHSGWEKLLP
jgi:hypothetical protein